jgi:hypothetical protein
MQLPHYIGYLLLESDDNPTITSIVASKPIAETREHNNNGNFKIKQAQRCSYLSGTAALNVDYTSSFPSKERSLLFTQLFQSYSSTYVQLSDGRYILPSNIV